MANNPPINVAQELGVLLSGDALEVLIDELTDPGCHFSRADRAKLGAVFEAVGKKMYADSKDGILSRTIEDDVVFAPRNASEPSPRVVDALVKQHYPYETNPELYKMSSTAASVVINLPFDKDTLDLPSLVREPEPAPADEDNFPDFGGPVDPFA